MAEYPPYVNSYGKIREFFDAIKKAAVPPKVTNDFIYSVLGLKSTSYRAFIPLLKKLGFLDGSSVPTPWYKDFRDDGKSGLVLGQAIKSAYSDLFAANEYANNLEKNELTSKIKTLTGAGEDDQYIPSVVNTFMELCKMAKFSDIGIPTEKKLEEPPTVPEEKRSMAKLGINYNINLNLPATTEIEVFNAIFKSLKAHILNE